MAPATGLPLARSLTTPAMLPSGGRRFSLSWLGTLPFFAYVGLFLLLPTAIIVVGSFFTKDGGFTLAVRDFNGDGVLDLAVVNSTVGGIDIFLGK